MKFFFTLLLLPLYCSVFGKMQYELTAQEIIDSSLKFCGGEERISKIKSSAITYLLTQPDKSTAVVDDKRIAGSKYTQCILSKNLSSQTTFFNGEKISKINGESVLHITDLKVKEEIKLKTYDVIQYAYKVLNYELIRLKDQKFKNFDCYVISATAKHGYNVLNFIDKTNFRLLMVSYPSGNKSLMINYLFKDSILFNSEIINTYPDIEGLQVLKLISLKRNVDISDLWFNCPYSEHVSLPKHIETGKFESTDSVKTRFNRTKTEQDYFNTEGQLILRRLLKWRSTDSFTLVDEKSKEKNPPEIIVRIVSWNDKGYVCQWMTEKKTETEDYEMKR